MRCTPLPPFPHEPTLVAVTSVNTFRVTHFTEAGEAVTWAYVKTTVAELLDFDSEGPSRGRSVRTMCTVTSPPEATETQASLGAAPGAADPASEGVRSGTT